MSKYLIHIEQVGDEIDEEFEQVFGEGIEADAFVIISDAEKQTGSAIHGFSIDTLSDVLEQHNDLLAASILAKAKSEAHSLRKPRSEKSAKDAKSILQILADNLTD